MTRSFSSMRCGYINIWDKIKISTTIIMSNRPTINSINDELSWDAIHQLHSAISNFSKQSFDIKKLFITIVVSALTLIYSIAKSIIYHYL